MQRGSDSKDFWNIINDFRLKKSVSENTVLQKVIPFVQSKENACACI